MIKNIRVIYHCQREFVRLVDICLRVQVLTSDVIMGVVMKSISDFLEKELAGEGIAQTL
ncbi:MAG: hypothetical protein IME96_07160 [Proteobacteria bacterium]|nr:hypothetical protein [Pseudomonadota bacterium]